MKKKEAQEMYSCLFDQINVPVCIITTSNGVEKKITGNIIAFKEPGIVVNQSQGGRIIISYESIHSFAECPEVEAKDNSDKKSIAIDTRTNNAYVSKEVLPQKTEDLDSVTISKATPKEIDHGKEIKEYRKENKEARQAADQINSILNDARKNHALGTKKGKIKELLLTFLEQYHSDKPACYFAAKLYIEIEEYQEAISVYKYCEDENNALYLAQEKGLLDQYEFIKPKQFVTENKKETNDKYYKGVISLWNPEKRFGLIHMETKICGIPSDIITFHLSSVSDKALCTFLFEQPAEHIVNKIHVLYKIGIYNERICAAFIENDGTDLLNCSVIRTGFIGEYNRLNEYGRIFDPERPGNTYGFIRNAVIHDPYLVYYLNNFLKFQEIEVKYVLGADKNGRSIASHIISTQSGRNTIINAIGKVPGTEKFDSDIEKKRMEALLGMKSSKDYFHVNYVQEFYPLPLWDGTPITKEEINKDIEIKEDLYKESEGNLEDPLKGRDLYDRGCKDPYSKGYTYMTTQKPDLAKEYFLDSIQKGIKVESALSSLITVLCRIEKDPYSYGIRFLVYYEHMITEEKNFNLRMMLLQKSTYYEKMTEEIDRYIPYVYNPTKKMHYLQLKAYALAKLEQYGEAADVMYEFQKIALSEKKEDEIASSEKRIALYSYLNNDYDKAVAIAGKLLQRDSHDNIALAIINREKITIETSNNEVNDLFQEEAESLRGYPKYYVYETLKIGTMAQGQFKELLDGDKIVGNPVAVANEIIYYEKRYIRGQVAANMAKAWAFLANISEQLINQYPAKKEIFRKKGITREYVNTCAGRAMLYQGNAAVLATLASDSIRFYYIEALKLIGKNYDADTGNALNRLICSYYASNDELKDIVNYTEGLAKKHLEFEAKRKCNNLKGLIIAMFQLVGGSGNNYNSEIREILERIYTNPKERKDVILSFDGLLESKQAIEIMSSEKYYETWLRLQQRYHSWNRNVKNTIKRFVEDIDSNEARIGHIQFLEETIEKNWLFDEDHSNLNRYHSLLSYLQSSTMTNDFDRREEIYAKVIRECTDFIEAIEEAPTSLSFKYIREALKEIRAFATQQIENLYKTHLPNLVVSCDEGFLHDNIIPFTLKLKNDHNTQTAEITNIDFEYAGNVIKDIRKGQNTQLMRVKSDETIESSYEAVVDLQNNPEYVEFTIIISYSYKDSIDVNKQASIKEPCYLSLRDESHFKQIENVYHRIANGTGVSGRMFRGREKEMQKIVDQLQNEEGMLVHKGIFMHGQKRAGKTSILINLQEKIEDRYGKGTYLFFDIGSIGSVGGTSKFSGILVTMMNEVKRTLRKKYTTLYEQLISLGVTFRIEDMSEKPEQAPLIFNMVFREINDYLYEIGGENKYIPLFLIDEFTYLYQWLNENKESEIQEFPHFWKAFLQNYRVCCIVVGQDNAPKLINMPGISNDFACMELWPVSFLDENGAKELMEEPIRKEDGSSRYDKEALRIMYQLTAGSAYLIAILCDMLVDLMNENKYENVTVLILKQLIHKWLKEYPEKDTVFESQLVDPSKLDYDIITTKKDNEIIIRSIALNAGKQLLTPKSKIQYDQLSTQTMKYRDTLLDELERRNVIMKKNNGTEDVYQIKVDLLRLYELYINGTELDDLW